jgi:hypothetical protein
MPSRAVVIGPAHYAADSGIDSHPQIGWSAQMYGQVLAGDAKWRSNHRVLTSAETHTTDSVMRVLEDEARLPGANDLFLVVYVGHGAFWNDIPDAQVHFSVSTSSASKPWTWLSSWYLYRAMRRSRAKLKVLIADCCYSNLLQHLGPDLTMPGVLGQSHEGTCVFTAVKNTNYADVPGCPTLAEEFSSCTPFSGHLLKVLRDGTTDYNATLTVGLLRDTVQAEMEKCPNPHHESRMVLNDARENSPLFTNRMDVNDREPPPRRPVDVDQWVKALRKGDDSSIGDLLTDPRKTGEVVERLYNDPDEQYRRLALRINSEANSTFTAPLTFAQYWNRVERKFRS